MLPQRGHPPVEAELLSAVRARFEQLELARELRLSKAWEICLLAQQYVGLASATPEPLDVASVLEVAVLAIGPAALASNPSYSDVTLGRVTARRSGRQLSIDHERRPIDPMDFLRAFTLAAIVHDRATLAGLARAVEYVEPDLVFGSRFGSERLVYRAAFGALTQAALGRLAQASALALEAQKLARSLDAIDRFRVERIERLVLPLSDAVRSADRNAAIAEALRAHHSFWSEEHRRADPSGFIAWGPLALIGLFGGDTAELAATGYAPESLLLVAAASEPRAQASVIYDIPELGVRTVLEARLRAELTTRAAGLPAPHVVEVERSQLTDGRVRLRLVVEEVVQFVFSFVTDSSADDSLGAGTSSVLDAGELVHLAEERKQLSASADPSEDADRQRRLGKLFAEQALAFLGDEDELFRDRMTSPLGRKLCDERPTTFSRGALCALVDSFG